MLDHLPTQIPRSSLLGSEILYRVTSLQGRPLHPAWTRTPHTRGYRFLRTIPCSHVGSEAPGGLPPPPMPNPQPTWDPATCPEPSTQPAFLVLTLSQANPLHQHPAPCTRPSSHADALLTPIFWCSNSSKICIISLYIGFSSNYRSLCIYYRWSI